MKPHSSLIFFSILSIALLLGSKRNGENYADCAQQLRRTAFEDGLVQNASKGPCIGPLPAFVGSNNIKLVKPCQNSSQTGVGIIYFSVAPAYLPATGGRA